MKNGVDTQSDILFLQTFAYASIGMAIVGLDGRLVKVNQSLCNMIGYAEEELLACTYQELAHPDDLAVDQNYRKQLLSGRIDSYQMRKRLVSKEGELFWVLLHNNLIRDEQGDPQYFLSQFQGRLTEKEQECILLEKERKMAQELLRNSEKLTIAGQLAAGIAHEIRNPLTSLKGFLQLMKAGAEYREDYLNIMESELSRIENIVNELLYLAKPKEHRFAEKDVQTLLQNVITLLEPQANYHNVEILATYTPGLTIHCDENQIKQVFINMIKNAIESMATGGRLTIEARAKGDSVMIRFSDEGCGIPVDKLKKLGVPFYTTKENGTGLGLMVSYNIVENHKGNIHVISKVGKGTTFTISLPLSVSSKCLQPALQ